MKKQAALFTTGSCAALKPIKRLLQMYVSETVSSVDLKPFSGKCPYSCNYVELGHVLKM